MSSLDPHALQITVIQPDGGVDAVDLPEEEGARLRKLQELVGGHIEVVPVTGRRYLVVSESAKDTPHLVNQSATAIAHECESIQPGDYLAGTVLIVPQQALV